MILEKREQDGDDEGTDKLFFLLTSAAICAERGRGGGWKERVVGETIIDLIGTFFFFLSLLFISPLRPLCNTKRELIRFKSG